MTAHSSILAQRVPWTEEPWAAIHRVAQSQTRLKRLSMHACIGEGNGNPLQYFCLENPRDRGAWWAAVYGVAQSWTQLKRLSSSSRQGLTRYVLSECLCDGISCMYSKNNLSSGMFSIYQLYAVKSFFTLTKTAYVCLLLFVDQCNYFSDRCTLIIYLVTKHILGEVSDQEIHINFDCNLGIAQFILLTVVF